MDTSLKEIKELAKKFTAEELNLCIDQQLKKGKNICDVSGPTIEVLNILSKAEYVKNLMNQGISMTDAVANLQKKYVKFRRVLNRNRSDFRMVEDRPRFAAESFQPHPIASERNIQRNASHMRRLISGLKKASMGRCPCQEMP